MSKPETDQDLARLESQIAALRDDIAHIVTTLGDLSQTSAETLRASLAARAEALRQDGAARLADVGGSAEAKLAELTDHARRNPWQALAVAGGIGLLLGLLWERR
jgi:ElaB/YqjD/DUF883 family membrane-anchored ribosome-binding protein